MLAWRHIDSILGACSLVPNPTRSPSYGHARTAA